MLLVTISHTTTTKTTKTIKRATNYVFEHNQIGQIISVLWFFVETEQLTALLLFASLYLVCIQYTQS